MTVRENIKSNVKSVMHFHTGTDVYEFSSNFIATVSMCHEAVKSHLIIEIIMMP